MIHCTFGADLSTMAMNNALNGSQPDSGTFKLVSPMQALKNPKQFVHVFHIEPYPIISDKDDHLLAVVSVHV